MKDKERTQEEAKPTAEGECCERVDAEAKQPLFNDARIEPEAKEAKKVLAMVEAVKDYGLVMETCLQEATRLIAAPDLPGAAMTDAAAGVRAQVALALYSKATAITQQADVEIYLDKLIRWYEAKDSAPGESPVLSVPPFPVFTPTVGPTERLANLLLDFLESRAGTIFAELKGDQGEGANEERSSPAGE